MVSISSVHVLIATSSDLDREKVTKAKLSTVIRAVSKWSALAQIFDNPETLELIEMMEDELKRLMAGLGASVKPKNDKSKGTDFFYLDCRPKLTPSRSLQSFN